MRLAVEGRRRLRAGGRRPAPAVRAARRLPDAQAHHDRADHRRQPAAALRGLLRDHLQHGAVRRAGQLYAAAFGFSIEGDVGFDVLIQLVPVPLPRRVPRQRAAQARLAQLFKVSVEGARGAAAAARRAARRRSRSSGATSRSASTRRSSTARRPPTSSGRRARRAAAARWATRGTGRRSRPRRSGSW